MRTHLLIAAMVSAAGIAIAAFANARTLPLDRVGELTLVGARAEIVTYRGQRALHLRSRVGHEADDSMLAVVPNRDFKDGVMEIDEAGAPIPEVPSARAFVGVVFRVRADPVSFE